MPWMRILPHNAAKTSTLTRRRSFFVPKKGYTTRQLTVAGIIAALYAGLTLLLPVPQYMGVQLRVAEALTVLPFLLPEAVPGLAVGCFIANLLGSPLALDWVVGTAATLLAAFWTRRCRSVYFAPMPPVICNAVIVGAEIAWFITSSGGAFWPAYGLNALTVGLGELLACYALGLPLLRWLDRSTAMKYWREQRRL